MATALLRVQRAEVLGDVTVQNKDCRREILKFPYRDITKMFRNDDPDYDLTQNCH